MKYPSKRNLYLIVAVVAVALLDILFILSEEDTGKLSAEEDVQMNAINETVEAIFDITSGSGTTFTNSRYCEHDAKSNNYDCYQKLSRGIQNKTVWKFLGDSQTGFYTKNLFVNKLKHTWRDIARGPTCGLMEYMDLERSKIWKYPNHTLMEGPTKNGLRRHYCTDLAGWWADKGEIPETSFEYLPVEYALDVEHPSPTTRTTQESVALYFRNQNITVSEVVCVINTGIHDMAISKDTATFLQNVRSYFHLLDPVCGNFVWLGISHVRGDKKQPQNNDAIASWNTAVAVFLENEYPTKSYVIDVWKQGLNTTHRDNVHYSDTSYYEQLASLFQRLMKGGSSI